MANYKPVSVSRASFSFCRYSVALLVWLSFLLRSGWILGVVCLIFLLSAILKVKRAPMIRLYDLTVNRIIKSQEVLVDQNSIFFAHLMGLFMSGTCFVLISVIDNEHIWYSVLVFAVLKSISAFGFCPASKLYDCTMNGNCCVTKAGNDARTRC